MRFDPARHDSGPKTIFGQTGNWDSQDVMRLTLQRKGVAEHITTKLWAELVGTPLATKTRRSLVKQFQRSGRNISTLLAAILRAPQLYDQLTRPDMVKSPVVFIAGLLRTNGWRVERRSWAGYLTLMGQRPFSPPSVAGWDGGGAWCSTTAFRARFLAAHEILWQSRGLAPVKTDSIDAKLNPAEHLALAKRAARPAVHDVADRRRAARARGTDCRPPSGERPAEATQRRERAACAAHAVDRRPGQPALLMARRSPYTGCDDFHRTAEQRGSLAAPLTRREVVGLGLGAGIALYLTPGTPVQQALESSAEAAVGDPNARVLVSVFLPGGLDLLDSIVPLNQYGLYRDARGGNARPGTSPKLGATGLGVHDALARGNRGGVKGLFDQGKIGLLPGIDYANPNLSHFTSRQFWETGLITRELATGWLGRWADRFGSKDNPFQAIGLGPQLSPVLRTAGAPVAGVETPRQARLEAQLPADVLQMTAESYQRLGALGSKRGGRDAVNRAVRLTKRVADDLAPYEGSAPQPSQDPGANPLGALLPPPQPSNNAPAYPPGQLGDRLKTLAFLLSQPLGTRLAAVDARGLFDTHDNQALMLDPLLTELSYALSAFQLDIEQRGLADRVLVFVWSEFGRRLKSNASGGTDHGAGGIAWVQGTQARSGVLTDYPRLNDLDAYGNLKVTVDFRQVYASLIEQWLAADANAVIPRANELTRVGLVR